MGCLGFAGFFVVGMFINEILYDKDVAITQSVKGKLLRDDSSHTRTFTEIFPNNSYTNPVGLGVNHEEWKKAKEAAKK